MVSADVDHPQDDHRAGFFVDGVPHMVREHFSGAVPAVRAAFGGHVRILANSGHHFLDGITKTWDNLGGLGRIVGDGGANVFLSQRSDPDVPRCQGTIPESASSRRSNSSHSIPALGSARYAS